MTSTLKADVLSSKTTNGDLTISGDGSGVPDLEAGFKVGSVAGVPTASIRDDAVTLAKMASGTDGQIITYDASGNPTAVGPGSDGEVLTSTGAGSPPAFEAAAGGGAWTFISTGTASSSATISFTNLSSSYAAYVVVINDLVPSTSADILLRTSTDNGSSYDNSSSDYSWGCARWNAYTTTQVHQIDSSPGPNTSITLFDSCGNDTGEIVAGFVYIFNPAGTLYTTIRSDLWGTQNDGVAAEGNGIGIRKSAADCDAIQFFLSTGTVTSGTFRLYGINPS